MPKRVKVIEQGPSGLNKRFKDNFNGQEMTRGQFVKQIEQGNYPNHHVMKIGNMKVPRTNPDSTRNNNLG